MSYETIAALNLLARLLLDARLTAANLVMNAHKDGLDVADYDLIDDIAAVRERLARLMERGEDK